MILLLTNSADVTTDILMPHLTRHAEVFRFNLDLWKEYTWNIHADGYEISDPLGRVCTEARVGAVYERKVMHIPLSIDVPAGGCPENWLREEVFEIWSGIKDLAFGAGKLALIHPSPSGVWKKMRQMRLAAKYFPVPAWQMLHKAAPQCGPQLVCKCNSGQNIGNNRLFNVSRVDPARIDLEFPWFLQQAVDAVSDVTVAYINGKLYASEYSRAGMQGMDCRKPTSEGKGEWTPCELSADEAARVRAMMAETGFTFSRLDFLRTADGTLHFLEFNVNGQYAWIDVLNKRGMLTAIADEVARVHNRNLPQ